MIEIAKWAAFLEAARTERREVGKVTEQEPSMTIPDAYRVQDEVIRLREARGERRIGYKMGLTSRAKMKQMGVSEPIYGVLTDRMRARDACAMGELIHPRIEPEVYFVTSRELSGKITQDEALAACAKVGAALEIIDSRYKDFNFTLADVVADNCSSAAFVLGEPRSLSGLDVSNLGMILEVDGKSAQFGSSAAIYGHPAASLAELCAMLAARGLSLPAGSIVLAGAATAAVPFTHGSTVRALVEGLEPVSVRAD
jgi:2-oxo-3-hexenedioate decarboxylase